jgi:uncharacterized protein YkwD
MRQTNLVFRILIITFLASTGLFPARAGDEPAGVIGEPYSILALTRPTITGDNSLNYTGCGGVNVAVVNAAYEQEVLDLVNTYRADEGLPPLKRVTALDYAARYHATDLGQDNYFSHDSYDRVSGNLEKVCGAFTRMSNYYPDASAENIAAGYFTPQSVMNGWMNSSGHRANILSTYNQTIGIGFNTIANSDYYYYWVQDFGRPYGEYPLIINRDAASTDDRDVTLYIYGSFQQMRLKNDNGAWGGWQPFHNSFTWTLNSIAGERSVTAELKSSSATYTSSDTITLTGDFLPSLGNLPDSITFLYSIPDSRLEPANATFSPLNVTTSTPLTWNLSTAGSWFSAAPSSGVTPQSFQVTPDNFALDTVHTYTGSVTVTVNDPAETENSPHTINLTLIAVNTPIQKTFLPVVQK